MHSKGAAEDDEDEDAAADSAECGEVEGGETDVMERHTDMRSIATCANICLYFKISNTIFSGGVFFGGGGGGGGVREQYHSSMVQSVGFREGQLPKWGHVLKFLSVFERFLCNEFSTSDMRKNYWLQFVAHYARVILLNICMLVYRKSQRLLQI